MSGQQYPDNRVSKKRPVIAFFNGNMHYPSYRALIREVNAQFMLDDLDLHTYMGSNLTDFFDQDFMNNLCSENHFYSVFPYSYYDRPDLIVITMGGIVKDGNEKMVREFLVHFSDIPILMLENATEYPNVYHILLENYSGMYEMTEHMITEHGCRRLAHLAGPSMNDDAAQRRKAFEDALKAHNLEPVAIEEGNFTPHVTRQVNRLLDAGPDAVVCANDFMAGTVYKEAGKRKIRVGTDLKVTGFDDTSFARFMDPPLTTIRQDFGMIAETVVREVRRFLKGEVLRDVAVPARLVCRESCGCHPDTEKEISSNHHRITLEEQVEQMIIESVESSVTLRNMMFHESNEEEMFRDLGSTLYHLGARRSCILLHEQPIERNGTGIPDMPESIRMVMRQEGTQVTSWKLTEAPLVVRGGFREVFVADGPTRLTDLVLFYQEQEYGVLVVEVDPEDLMFFCSLSMEIGSGLRFHELSAERRAASSELEEHNQILSYVASHDSLTGLYNRAGIMNEIFRYVRSFPEGDRFALVMADLDHLKQINDTLGHNGGDMALRYASDVLHRVLPEGSPVGRNGGDEFIAAIHLADPEQDLKSLKIQERLRVACAECDEREKLPFYMGISAGMARFGAENLSAFLKVIEEADQELYKAKKHRRSYVIK